MGSTKHKPQWDECNKVLADKWNDLMLTSHHTRLANTKRTMHTQTPRVKSATPQRSTTSELMREKEIERENSRLARRFGQLDCPAQKETEPWRHSSLNVGARKKEQRRIIEENDKMLNRLNQTKTCFRRAQWECDEKERRRWAHNISENRFVDQ
ncbi:hypothetical protein AC1031_020439 [Aphanomyces cochlioides]|nr:hypothetical protein AC1031_020439 [Aphanomyces cochlioides]